MRHESNMLLLQMSRSTNASFIYTPLNHRMCGQAFRPRSNYLISGRIRISFKTASELSSRGIHVQSVPGRITRGRLETTMCDFNGLWNSLTKWQKKGITSLYRHACDCNVSKNNLRTEKKENFHDSKTTTKPQQSSIMIRQQLSKTSRPTSLSDFFAPCSI